MVAGRWCQTHRMALARWCHAGQASSPARLTLAWPGITCPHPVECTGQPDSTALPYPDTCSLPSPECAGPWPPGQWAVRSWLGVTHRVASPGTATAGGLQVGAGCAGWSGIYVLTSVWCGLVGAWWLSRRCCTHPVWRDRGGAIHRWGLAGAGWIAQIFFGQGGDLAVPRAYTYQTPHSCVGHNR